jgi:fatty acid desaturase
VEPRPISHYANAVRRHLPPDAFAPAPSRLLWLLLHASIVVAGITSIVAALGPAGSPVLGAWRWLVASLLALVVGQSFAGMAFVAHEVLHGSVIRHPRLRYLAGSVAFAPFCISARHWIAWHNRTHHGHTMEAGVDPDAFPTLVEYRTRRVVRFGDRLALGYGRIRGLAVLAVGLSIQSLTVLARLSRQRGYLDRKEHRLAVAETLAMAAGWALLGILIGPLAFLFAFVFPLMIANAVVMAYIMSNHSLSPLTDVNDPLLNTLSVTTPRILEVLHLDFGLHVEHHLFPSMSPRYAGAVRDALVAQFPDRYQSMPLWQALLQLFGSPRVYKDATTLVDPRNGAEWRTLMPMLQVAATTVAAR